jgi:probable F420-dependent oxidoreductase
VKVGVLVQNFAGFPDTGRSTRACVDLAVHAERAGFDSVWVTDHIVLPKHRIAPYPHNDEGTFPYSWQQDIHDPIVLLGALAQATQRAEIGVAVLVIPYRHPLTTAKMIATADQLAEGRIVLGAGVGWLQDEFDALGLSDDVFAHRGSVTEDYLRAMLAAWTADGAASYDGAHIRFRDVGTYPRPARQPHPPIWIGGKGDRALRRAARLGDGYLAIASDPSVLRHEVGRLREFAEQGERATRELAVALIEGIAISPTPLATDRSPLHGSAEQIVEGIHDYADAGLQHLVAGVRLAGAAGFAPAVDALDLVAAEVLPHVR